ncbi:hypothetical protein Droror1_Dr00008717 [Drosera rotundifolia]
MSATASICRHRHGFLPFRRVLIKLLDWGFGRGEMIGIWAQASNSVDDEVDLDELMDKEAEKREAKVRQGHGEYREVTEGEFLGEVTTSDLAICHFYHKGFYRCKIMDKHLKSLAPKYIDTKFIKLDAENAPFFVSKLSVKTLPCVIFFRKGIAFERLIGFQDLGGKDDFSP